MAARWERAGQVVDLAVGIVGIGEEVRDGDEEKSDGFGQVEGGVEVGVIEDGVGLAQVGVDVGGGPAVQSVGQQSSGVGEDDGVVVDVDDAGGGVDRLGDFVDVVGGGNAGADVEELP